MKRLLAVFLFFVISFLSFSYIKAESIDGGIDFAPESADVFGGSFLLHLNISNLEPNTRYYVKPRFHQVGQTKYYGYTFNDEWLSQNSSWSAFPTLVSDEIGRLVGFIKVKNSSLPIGEAFIQIALRQDGKTTTLVASIEASLILLDNLIEAKGSVYDVENIFGGSYIIARDDSHIYCLTELAENESIISFNEYFSCFVPNNIKIIFNIIDDDMEAVFSSDTFELTGPIEIVLNQPDNEEPVAIPFSNKTTYLLSEIFALDGFSSFDADGMIVDYIWQFPDGTSEYGQEITHWFQKSGKFEIILKVIDDMGGVDRASIIIMITNELKGAIQFNELFPTGEEWVELIKKNDQQFQMTGWYLQDGSEKKYKFSESIFSSNYLSFILSKSLILNDAHETVTLYSPEDNIVDSVSYDNAQKEGSLSLFQDEWLWTTTPTFDKENILTELPEIELPMQSIEQVRNLSRGTFVKTSGIIIAPFDILGRKRAYIQDDKAGIAVVLAAGSISVVYGDKVELMGKLYRANGELYIKVFNSHDIIKSGDGQDIISDQISASDLINFESRLAMVKGKVIAKRGKTLYLESNGRIKISILKSTGIDVSAIARGDIISAVGVVQHTGMTFRFLPRYPSDLVIISQNTNTFISAQRLKKSYNAAPSKTDVQSLDIVEPVQKDAFFKKTKSELPVRSSDPVRHTATAVFVISSLGLCGFLSRGIIGG